ncbi:MAG: P27 family phage terminase small subunit [Candidatus Hydrogenedentes bacterium]|nr:P27 family phage terminase small subunit [Candidatus Hydrogenedentota bacterium]
MGKRGPQPTPVEILEARGSRNIKNREQPEFRPNCPPCPDYMPKRGREYWEHIVPIVSRSRVLTEADWGSLCALCLAWSEIWKAHATLEVEGRYVEGQKGNYAPHPAIHVMQMAGSLSCE